MVNRNFFVVENDGETRGVLRDGEHVFHVNERWDLLSYEGPGGEVTVPDGVRSVCKEAFAFCSHVTGVILPEGVRHIEVRAFYRSGIRSVSLPDSLESIAELAFAETPLESIEIPDQVLKVGPKAFFGAKNLKKAKLSKKMESLEPSLFTCCISLQEVILPENLKYIQGGVFMLCTSLEDITLPEGVIAVWTQAFCGCSGLREIYLGDHVEAIGGEAFRDCTALERVRIPAGLRMKDGYAFGNTGRMMLTGPGQESGLIVSDDPRAYFFPEDQKLVIAEGVDELIYLERVFRLLPDTRILDLPKSLQYYSWYYFTHLRSLRQIVTDRDALAAEIAMMLDVECMDRDGRKFTYQVPKKTGKWIPKKTGKWIVEKDEEHGGLRLMGCSGRIGHTGEASYTTVVIPDTIDGKPVTCIGEDAFRGYDFADAFYIPDSVQRIERRAFACNGFCTNMHGRLFLRLPEDVSIEANAFEGTAYYTRSSARQEAHQKAPAEAKKEDRPAFADVCAEKAADDPAIGTGTAGRPSLQPNIWQYFDRLRREDRIRELTHSFVLKGEIDGAGWATVEIELDGKRTGFRISYIGSSPGDFRRFAKEIEDGDNESFGWSAEPGYYPWRIQCRGGIFYVNAPHFDRPFFIPREQFLSAAAGLTAEWNI